MQVEQTTRRRFGLTGMGISVRGFPTRYWSASAPQASFGGDGAAATAFDSGGGGAGGGATGAAAGGGGLGAGVPHAANASMATSAALKPLCAIRSFLPAANRTPRSQRP